MFDSLKAQIDKTSKNLERGEVLLADRIFLNHVLDELEFIVSVSDRIGTHLFDADEALGQMLGSCNELVEDGLED